MPTKVFETYIKAPVQKLWDFHSSASALRILTPAEQEIQLISKNLDVREGALHEMKTKQFGIWITWKARITKVNPPHGFTDTAEKSPFKSWTHHHDFIENEGDCILRDTIHYELKGGPLAKLIDEVAVSEKLDKMFNYRHRVTKEHLETEQAKINAELFDSATSYVSDFELHEPKEEASTP
jgi:ligand-binding SRPBCC domain-containing protein